MNIESFNAVEIQNVTKRFKNVVAVADFSLAIKKGELITLLGPSGCGKTTLLRVVAGFERPDRGKVLIFGRDVTNVPPERRDVSMVFQNYALFPHMTVFDNIAFPMRIAKKPKKEIIEKVREYLSYVRLEGLEKRYVHQLSGGQKQRVALARALAKSPKILLLDEPLSALDAKIRVQLREETRQLQKRLGITTLYVTHDQEEALSISDRVVVMRDGVIEQVGTPEEIYFRPATSFVAFFVGTMNFFSGITAQLKDSIGLWFNNRFLMLPKDTVVPVKTELTVGVRPERITLFTDLTSVPAGYNILLGKVWFTSFLGPVTRVEVMLENNVKLRVDVPTSQDCELQIGQEVLLGFKPEDMVILGKREEVVAEGDRV
ncbi:MAG: ABC transporter ATP-binding protein [Candidatus Bathyarchaeia archaeon]